MGIPSYYRSLIRRYPKIISGGAGSRAKWLCLDFNCAMYYVLGKQPPFPSPAKQTQWEQNFRKEICDYLRQLVQIANPVEGVYVGVDGVVCAAKRRQQRLRRFKRPWEDSVMKRLNNPTETEIKWDSTALTPGTDFMDQLGKDLCLTGDAIREETGLDVIISTASEPGEGEHKLMKQMRSIRPNSCTIYGLDADLILLALLLGAETESKVLLLREAQEFEYRDAGGGFRNLNITDLGHAITETSTTFDENYCRRIRDYVASMSLLGNDFLPKSLTRTIRDSGVESLLEILKKEIWIMNKNLICPETNQIQTEELRKIIEKWAETEESDMIRAVQAAIAARTRPIRVMDETQRAIEEWKMEPSRWCSIARIWNPTSSSLCADWREIVRSQWGSGNGTPEEYLAGLAWIWDYYNGKPVCQGWVYDCHLPPLWGDLLSVLKDPLTRPLLLEPPKIRYEAPLSAWIHLLSVLPESSVRSLLPDKRKQSLLFTHPWYWQSSWSLFDIGRTQMWECEPVIPLIPEALLRKIDSDEP